ncbi:MAG TPA: hypothetical protein VE869_03715 [Gemmatimonas sp.]|nr:hypothetical protein [Gemmatimonas sp.]
MTRGTLLSLVNVSLIAGLAFAVTDVVAQVPTSPTPLTLVYTTCGHGEVTVCGTEPVGQHCTYQFGFTGGKGAFGFNFGGVECTGGGTQNRYKDFDPNHSSGTCIVLQRPPADATSVAKDEALEESASDAGAIADETPSFVRVDECSSSEEI